jgi:hypothetical protein
MLVNIFFSISMLWSMLTMVKYEGLPASMRNYKAEDFTYRHFVQILQSKAPAVMAVGMLNI